MNENLINGYILGGLGNQLFVIYTTLSLAIRFNKKPVFLDSKTSPSITKRYTYWDTIFKNLNLMSQSDINRKKWIKINDAKNWTEFNVDKGREDSIKQNNILLSGYFQSYKNFIKEKDDINRILDIPTQINNIKNKYKENSENKIEGKDIIVFCEKDDIELVTKRMNNIISRLDNKNRLYKIFKKSNNELEQMFLLSCFKNIVIANSSFSWWSGFFSENSNVFIPNKWFHKKTSDNLILDHWTSVGW